MGERKVHSKKPIIGYTSGVYDLFHIGHLNLLRNAKSMCDHLIVAVTSDELVGYKYKKAVVPFVERVEIVRSIKYVDTVVGQYDMDKFAAWKKLKFDKMFVGDDWFETDEWKEHESQFEEVGVPIIYIPYTQGTSSSMLNAVLNEIRNPPKKK
ncbi:MAG: adenylyltransferase/cytidyltransferase family protein [Candidatus Zixiibacteriota bacterium]|nr:MAG: adenylyltransferase/cytidyltransferase family protein [candidate division Zixibacteria bacterium]